MALPKMEAKPHAPTLVYAVVILFVVIVGYHLLLRGRKRR